MRELSLNSPGDGAFLCAGIVHFRAAERQSWLTGDEIFHKHLLRLRFAAVYLLVNLTSLPVG
ncbi:hypothetical protein [Telluria beijingensis]|uniref:hypothetical protein n=1 Tax=Telluria beijingensis TaxID=3068633 RepID=UPI0027963B63|nr:hypothetical protein [Massilia sp. REN29]